MCEEALRAARVTGQEIDLVNGHLTATGADPSEVRSWSAALDRSPEEFPCLQSTKSLIGHALGAAGAIESVACILQLHHGFAHPSINCEDLHPEIVPFKEAIVRETRELPSLRTIAKASFGFGDVNACVVFRKYEGDEE